MDAAEIDVGSGIFECGQTYVALSRVKSLDGLYLTSFDAQRIRVNKKVREYYDSLQIYYERRETHQEEYVPIITAEPISEPITITQPIITNPFQNYQYTQDIAELAEEKYESQNSDVKIIKL
jgi:hypothetical protein